MIAQEGAMASTLLERSSRGLSYRAYSSKGKERNRGQSKKRNQKIKTCRKEEEEKKIRVHPITPEQDNSGKCHPLKEY